MNDFIALQLANRNTYLFINKYDFKYQMYVNPSLIPFLMKKNNLQQKGDDLDYYQRKAAYLRSKLPEKEHTYKGRTYLY